MGTIYHHLSIQLVTNCYIIVIYKLFSRFCVVHPKRINEAM